MITAASMTITAMNATSITSRSGTVTPPKPGGPRQSRTRSARPVPCRPWAIAGRIRARPGRGAVREQRRLP
jgi:hypothetical protein